MAETPVLNIDNNNEVKQQPTDMDTDETTSASTPTAAATTTSTKSNTVSVRPVPKPTPCPSPIQLTLDRATHMSVGDHIIVYQNRSEINTCTLAKGAIYSCRFGNFHHDDMIGKMFGTKVTYAQCTWHNA